MKNKRYMILLVDRERTKMFTLINGVVDNSVEYKDGHVPQKVKHGDDTWDSQDKIFRHIEDHLHRHLALVAKRAAAFAKEYHITEVIIGSHKPLFSKIEEHLAYPLSERVKGKFVTELKAPFNEILRRTKRLINQIELEEKETEER